MSKLNTALSKIQSELNAPKSQYNNFGKYNYRSCEDILGAVKPLLAGHGIVLTMCDEMKSVGDRIYVEATVKVSLDSEVVSATAFAREPESRKGMDAAQVTGATSSYARKYALNGLFAIDDTKDADTYKPSTASQPAEQDNGYVESLNMKDFEDGEYDIILEAPPAGLKEITSKKGKKFKVCDVKVLYEAKPYELTLFDNEVEKDFPDGIKSAKVNDTIRITKKGWKRVFVKIEKKGPTVGDVNIEDLPF